MKVETLRRPLRGRRRVWNLVFNLGYLLIIISRNGSAGMDWSENWVSPRGIPFGFGEHCPDSLLRRVQPVGDRRHTHHRHANQQANAPLF